VQAKCKCFVEKNLNILAADKLETNTRTIILATTIPVAFLLMVIFVLTYLFLKNRRKHQYLLLSVQESKSLIIFHTIDANVFCIHFLLL
jgi:uncharacterized BrkB/YihY/UPF0761 family membrane protein